MPCCLYSFKSGQSKKTEMMIVKLNPMANQSPVHCGH